MVRQGGCRIGKIKPKQRMRSVIPFEPNSESLRDLQCELARNYLYREATNIAVLCTYADRSVSYWVANEQYLAAMLGATVVVQSRIRYDLENND